MAITIERERVLVTDTTSNAFLEFRPGVAENRNIEVGSGDGLPIEISQADLGLLIQALKAFHNTGSFIVGEE